MRNEQSYGSRLAEVITGLRPDNPELAKRILHDQEVLRQRYGLPDIRLRSERPAFYEAVLRRIAKQRGVIVRSKSDSGDFFDEFDAIATFSKENDLTITVDIDRGSLESYISGLKDLEHEIIHALQSDSDNMPIEVREYEAYIATVDPKFIDALVEFDSLEEYFSDVIGGSVNAHYAQLSSKAGGKVAPHWDNPDYFLQRVDGDTTANDQAEG